MSDAVIVAVLSLIGTGVGSFISVITSMRVTNLKIENLEKAVSRHNNLIERTYKLEERAAITEEKMEVANHRIADLEASALKREV